MLRQHLHQLHAGTRLCSDLFTTGLSNSLYRSSKADLLAKLQLLLLAKVILEIGDARLAVEYLNADHRFEKLEAHNCGPFF